jgi:hypothetical protein
LIFLLRLLTFHLCSKVGTASGPDACTKKASRVETKTGHELAAVFLRLPKREESGNQARSTRTWFKSNKPDRRLQFAISYGSCEPICISLGVLMQNENIFARGFQV